MSTPVLQQPQWPDRDRLEAVVRRLEGLPPLVLAAECDQLKERLASVARGEAFLLQGGDCAETFAGTTAGSIRGKFQTLLQMAVVLTYAAAAPADSASVSPLAPARAAHDKHRKDNVRDAATAPRAVDQQFPGSAGDLHAACR